MESKALFLQKDKQNWQTIGKLFQRKVDKTKINKVRDKNISIIMTKTKFRIIKMLNQHSTE